MKEILFRGKTLDTNEWVYGYFVNCVDDVYPHVKVPEIIEATARRICRGEYYCSETYEVDPKTVCQFIGDVDKNGKKMFEGDILEYYGGIGECSIKGFVVIRELVLMHEGVTLGFARTSDYEVIGNIFDNPELVDKYTKLGIRDIFNL